MKLDRSRPFGTIHPQGGFVQDGNEFDADGNLVGEKKAPKVRKREPEEVVKPSDDQLNEQLAD